MTEYPTRRGLERRHRPLRLIDRAEDLAHYIVALTLLVIAGIVLYQTAAHLVENRHHFAVQATSGINDVLFVVIVAAVRHILGVGARLTLADETTQRQFVHAQIELGVSAALVLALAVSFILISRAGVD